MLMAGWTAIAAALLLFAGCGSGSSDSGEGGAPSGVAGPGGGGASSTTGGVGGAGGAGGEEVTVCPSLGDPCSACLSIRCQESYCDCQRNPECSAAANCMLGCAAGDASCNQACLTAHEPGIASYFIASGCAFDRCDAQCPASVRLSACDACLFAVCSVEMSACYADPVCRSFLACAATCDRGDAPCQEACAVDHASGAPAARAVFACGGSSCTNACP